MSSEESKPSSPSPDAASSDTEVGQLPPKIEATQIEIPDGGLHAWMTVAGGWLVFFSTVGFFNSFGVFQDFYTREWLSSSSPSAISWIGSTQLAIQYTMGIFVGKAFDEGYFHPLMISGSLLYVFSLFMLTLSKPGQYYQVLLSQGIGAGIGLGILFLPALSIISHHFRKRRALAIGVVFSGTSFGGIVFPILLNNLIKSIGFANGVRAAVYIIFGAMLLANLLMRTRLPPRSKRNMPPNPSPLTFASDVPYMLTMAGLFLIALGAYFPAFYLQLDAITHGVDPTFAFYAITILNGASVAGRIIPNALADRFGVLNVTILSTILCSIILFTMIPLQNTGGVIGIGISYGFWFGAVTSMIGAVVPALSSNVFEIGVRMGVAFVFLGIAGLIGTPINGALLTDEFHWLPAIVFSATALLLSAVFLFGARQLLARRKGKQLV